MVNLTESFTKLYGRRPTEAEIATMMQMKREQENWKKAEIKKKTAAEPVAQKKPREPRTPKKINEYAYKWPKRASQLAQRVNRMLCIHMTIDDIAYVEGVSENAVMAQIEKWHLPREK
jgi:hypothetical protein